ncbi:MAG: D-amino-acid transaminase [Pseudomonadota bacterium]
MPRIAYVDGRYLPHDRAGVHIEDRGYQFADGVYEVCAVLGGKVLDFAPHMARLRRSLNALAIPCPVSPAAMAVIVAQVLRRNHLREGIVYIQVTRGVAPRDHGAGGRLTPVLVMTARRLDFKARAERARKGVAVTAVADERWARCAIKSVSLLPNVLAKRAAGQAGGYEAWMVNQAGMVTEGASSNCWIVGKDGVLRTHPLTPAILEGITRQTVARLAAALGLVLEERAFTLAEAREAGEAFITSSTNFVMPVVAIDGVTLGSGRPGPVSLALAKGYWRHVAAQTGIDYWLSSGGSAD